MVSFRSVDDQNRTFNRNQRLHLVLASSSCRLSTNQTQLTFSNKEKTQDLIQSEHFICVFVSSSSAAHTSTDNITHIHILQLKNQRVELYPEKLHFIYTQLRVKTKGKADGKQDCVCITEQPKICLVKHETLDF